MPYGPNEEDNNQFTQFPMLTETKEQRSVRNLTEDELNWSCHVKDIGQQFLDKIAEIAHTTTTGGASRELSIAKTKIQEAVMWTLQHITRP